MRINSIDNQIFQAKKFRLPIKKLIIPHLGTIDVNCMKEYDNPNAEMLYKKALQTSDIKEKAELLSQMGDYRILDARIEEIVNKFIKSKLA